MTISVEHRGRVYTWTKAGIYNTGMGNWRTDKGNIVVSRPLKAKLERLAEAAVNEFKQGRVFAAWRVGHKGGAA